MFFEKSAVTEGSATRERCRNRPGGCSAGAARQRETAPKIRFLFCHVNKIGVVRNLWNLWFNS